MTVCLQFFTVYSFTSFIIQCNNNRDKMPQFEAAAVGSLPKQFVIAMRTLFDIMDDDKTGFVKFSDIKDRWKDDGTKGLPEGVLECLKNITPHDGFLSFDQFCSGLKICLLKSQRMRLPPHQQPQCLPPKIHINTNWSHKKTDGYQIDNPEYYFSTEKTTKKPQLPVGAYGPPKPPRTAINLDKTIHSEQDLANWQMSQSMSDIHRAFVTNRGSGDGKSATVPDGNLADVELSPNAETYVNMYQKSTNVRRREPRRHTLQNGIDYNMLKRVKKIEQEKDILLQGLTAIDKAREWYLKQLDRIQEKIKYLGRTGSHLEQWTEAQQERLELQRARVQEVGRQLQALAECWQRGGLSLGGLSLHMNLALSPQRRSSTTSPTQIAQLQQQNYLLTEDVIKKRERISMLEREKSSLIRELLQLRTKGGTADKF